MNKRERPIVESEELRLVAAAAKGDRDAQRELFERFRDDAYRTAWRITGREADALDVVQDSFIRAFASLANFQKEAGFRTWLLRIVTNRALDLLRSRKLRLAVSLDAGDDGTQAGGLADPRSAAEDAATALERADAAESVRNAVAALPPEQRAVIALYALNELTYGEIAEVLGVPIGTVMSRLYHARRRVRELLEN